MLIKLARKIPQRQFLVIYSRNTLTKTAETATTYINELVFDDVYLIQIMNYHRNYIEIHITKIVGY